MECQHFITFSYEELDLFVAFDSLGPVMVDLFWRLTLLKSGTVARCSLFSVGSYYCAQNHLWKPLTIFIGLVVIFPFYKTETISLDQNTVYWWTLNLPSNSYTDRTVSTNPSITQIHSILQ